MLATPDIFRVKLKGKYVLFQASFEGREKKLDCFKRIHLWNLWSWAELWKERSQWANTSKVRKKARNVHMQICLTCIRQTLGKISDPSFFGLSGWGLQHLTAFLSRRDLFPILMKEGKSSLFYSIAFIFILQTIFLQSRSLNFWWGPIHHASFIDSLFWDHI